MLVPRTVQAYNNGVTKSGTSEEYLLDNVITWADGSKEHVQIGNDGLFLLDDVKRQLVGIGFRVIFSWDKQGIQYCSPDELVIWDKELAYLERMRIRFITFDPHYVSDWPSPGTEEERWSLAHTPPSLATAVASNMTLIVSRA